MDGYDVEYSKYGVIYKVYIIKNKIKHYHNGYSSYKQMLSKHPELIR